MEILRRNTDYAIRAMINLGRNRHQGPVTAKVLATGEGISYQLACKLMQKLHNARLVSSCRGPAGGYELSKDISTINLLEIIETIQGPLALNRCLNNEQDCERKTACPVIDKLNKLQETIEAFLSEITLDDLVKSYCTKEAR